MAQTKYWRVRLRGELSHEQAHAALPEGTLNILRIHKERGETHVYFSMAEKVGAPEVRSRTGESLEEVSLEVVTAIG